MVEINNKTKFKINNSKIIKIVDEFLRLNKIKNKDVSIAIIGDRKMRRLNKIYRGYDKPTDVLSFTGEGSLLGEILIDYAQVKRQAEEFSKSTGKEFVFILVHGLLHLIGYDDKTEKERKVILELGEKFLNNIK